MKQSITLTLLIVILISGCQAGPSDLDEAATIVAQTLAAAPPTETSLPTATPVPADTPTLLPTSTPDFIATGTAQASTVLSEISGALGNAEVPYKEGSLLWQQSGDETIGMTGPQGGKGVTKELEADITAGNFIFKSDVTWNATGILICGVVFRSEPNLERGAQYQFYYYRLSGLPAYFIDAYEDGGWKYTISNTRFSGDLDVSNDGTNQFMLVALENQFVVYINGNRQGRFFDDSKHRFKGTFGFLAWQESGEGSCKFENSWIWGLPDEQ